MILTLRTKIGFTQAGLASYLGVSRLGLGDVVSQTGLSRLLDVTEVATGFGFLGLVVSYLPAFYQDYARREVRLSMLDAWAGSPPSAGELLRRLGQDDALSDLNPFCKNGKTGRPNYWKVTCPTQFSPFSAPNTKINLGSLHWLRSWM